MSGSGKGDLSFTETAKLWAGTVIERGGLPYPEVGKTRCMRDAFLNGIGASVPIGVLTFIHTKVVMTGCRAAVASCIVIGLGSWEYCKYEHKRNIELVKKTVDALNRDPSLLKDKDKGPAGS